MPINDIITLTCASHKMRNQKTKKAPAAGILNSAAAVWLLKRAAITTMTEKMSRTRE